MRLRSAAGLVLLLACLGLLAALAATVQDGEPPAIDTAATAFLHGFAGPPLDATMEAITTLGSTTFVATVLMAALLVLAWHRLGARALFLVVAMAGTWAIVEILKAGVDRARPQVDWAALEPGGSFPSGHVMLVLVLGTALALVASASRGRRARTAGVVLAVVLAVLVGASRVYLGHHHLTDVLGALAAGGAWLLVLAGSFSAGGAWLARRRGPVSGAGGGPR